MRACVWHHGEEIFIGNIARPQAVCPNLIVRCAARQPKGVKAAAKSSENRTETAMLLRIPSFAVRAETPSYADPRAYRAAYDDHICESVAC